MTFVKSALLGTAAAFVAVAGAQAADLPSKKAAPAQYVKICDAYGAGFFYIPGTETCLKVGGFVRAEFTYVPGKDVRTLSSAGGGVGALVASQVAGLQDENGIQVRGRVDLDARTQSAWGTVQTVVRLRGGNNTGLSNQGSVATNAAAIGPAGNAATAITMERAYIRFAGLSVGVADSAFTSMPSVMLGSFHWAGFANGLRTISYTATMGGGFSATVAIDNRSDWNQGGVAAHRLDTTYNLTGNVRVDQSWGYAQLSGTFGNSSRLNALGTGYDTSLGWAVALGVGFNLPMLAAGDKLNLVAAYADGMIGATQSSNSNAISNSGWGRLMGGIQVNVPNVTATSATAFGTVRSYSFGGIFTHYWTPSLRSHFAASWARTEAPTVQLAGAGALVPAAGTIVLGNTTAYALGANLIWSPVRNLDLGVEVYYANLRSNFQGEAARYPVWVAAGRPGASVDNWGTKMRIERTF